MPGATHPPIEFQKYEGLGNDFIVVDASSPDALAEERAADLCDRRFGIGADGVILVLPPRANGSDAAMRVINADGSIPEMCGNGIRCVAVHVARRRGRTQDTVRVDTDAGVRECSVTDDGLQGMVTVDMGQVRVLGPRSVEIAGQRVQLLTADAGNPHAVLFGAFGRSEVEHLGPRLATHPDFPRGTNVEFARVAGDGIDLVVWERGVGITMACGTGACATAAVACAQDMLSRSAPIAVRLPGGRLDVTIDEAGRATLRGPARHVYSGVVLSSEAAAPPSRRQASADVRGL